MRVLNFLLIALLALPCFANDNLAGFMSVELEGVPKETSKAYLALDGEIELELVQNPDGVWRGNFLLLPEFYQGLPSPVISLKDKQGKDVDVSRTDFRHHIASSTMPPASLPLALSAENLAIVVDSRVVGDSVRFLTQEGRAIKPTFAKDYISLPEGLDPRSVVAVSGVGIHGQEFVFETPLDVDVASPFE